MKVFVTGGAGFIGQHVVRGLVERGDSVRVGLAPGESAEPLEGLDVETTVVDIRDLPALRPAVEGCDAVIHMAAIYALWLPDYRPLYRVNVQGTRNVLQACLDAEVPRIVHTSSIAALGVEPGTRPATEDTGFNQHGRASHYVLSKHQAQRVAEGFAARGLPVVIVNPSFPFGEGDRRPTPTGKTVLRVVRGQYFAAGPGGLNVVDVKDVARGHLLALDKGKPGRSYLLSGTDVTISDFFDAVKRVAGIKRPHLRVPLLVLKGMGRIGDVVALFTEPLTDTASVSLTSQHLFFDCSRARSELGYTVTDMDDVLARSIAWFRQHGYLKPAA